MKTFREYLDEEALSREQHLKLAREAKKKSQAAYKEDKHYERAMWDDHEIYHKYKAGIRDKYAPKDLDSYAKSVQKEYNLPEDFRLDEISDDVLNRYIKGASEDVTGRLHKAHKEAETIEDKEKITDKKQSRVMGQLTALEKLSRKK